MNCYAVIVTYKNRFHLLQQVLVSAIAEGVTGIIIVDNNSHIESVQQLDNFIKENQIKTNIEVIKNASNTGSSPGFKQGMQYAFEKKDCEYIWLLDDDNKPEKGALENLKRYWKEKPNEVACLSAHRDSRLRYTRVLNGYKPEYILGPKNSFLYFHIAEIPAKILNRFIPRKEKRSKKPTLAAEIIAAQYGGMFFHKTLLSKIGYPRDDFFVYADDYEWSIRIHANGYKTHLVSNSKIEDLENSWNSSAKKQLMIQTLASSNPFRIYYFTRNRIVFEKENWVTNSFIYWINTVAYTFLFNHFAKKNSETHRAFHQAIEDASALNFPKRY